MNYFRYYLILLKQNIKNPFTIILILLLPVLCIFFSTNKNEINEKHIEIGYFIEADNPTSINEEFEKYEGIYHFIKYDNSTDLEKDILSQKLECGYVIKNKLIENMTNGNKANQVIVLQGPHTTLSAITNETVYSILFPLISKEAITRFYITNSDIKDNYNSEYNEDTINELYDKYSNGNYTFSFEYNSDVTDYTMLTSSILLNPLRGLIAILIMLSAFSGVLDYFTSQMSYEFSKMPIRIINIFIPTSLVTLSSLLCLSLISHTSVRHIVLLIPYSLLCMLVALIISLVVPNQFVLAGIIVFSLLGSLICTPIFIDIHSLIPAIKPLQYLFLPYYYLSVF